MSLFGNAKNIVFGPGDFKDNIGDREYIHETGDKLKIDLSQCSGAADDAGENILSWKFAVGSGAYDVIAEYSADNVTGYLNLYSESDVTETVSERIPLPDGKERTEAKLYIPFGRSMHDIQLEIGYTGNGVLEISRITLAEDTSYRWVPVLGYFLIFALSDIVIWLIFAVSARNARDHVRNHPEIPVLTVVAVIASLPVFADFLYTGHDMEFHLARIMALSGEISYGNFPARMLTDMLHGYGYPTSTFYCDLFIYPAACLYLAGIPLRMVWQIYIIAINAATVVISYVSFKQITQSRKTALIGAALYTLSIYRITDIYLRSAMGEFTAITFIPLVMLGLWKIYYETGKKGYGWEILTAGMTGIALSHLLTLEMIGLFTALFCVVEYKRTFSKYCLSQLVKAAASTVLMSVWFIVPMMISLKEGLRLFGHQKYIQSHGVYLSQLLNPFVTGTGYSAPGTYNEMPLSIGGGMIAAIALLLYMMMREGFKDRHKQKTALILILVSILFSMYFFPWDSIAGIFESRIPLISNLARMVQYPWRYLEIASALLSIVAVCGLRTMEKSGNKQAFHAWTAFLLLGTVLSLGTFYCSFTDSAKWTRVSNEYYTDKSIGEGEYLLMGAEDVTGLKDTVAGTDASDMEIKDYIRINGERRLTVNNHGKEGKVSIPVFAYPGYVAEDKDSGADISYEKGENACMELIIPEAYNGTVCIYYKEPFSWRVFELVSLITLLAFLAEIIYKRKSCNERTKQTV